MHDRIPWHGTIIAPWKTQVIIKKDYLNKKKRTSKQQQQQQ